MSYQGKYSGADIDRLLDKIDNMESVVVDDTITPESSNPVTSKAIYKAMESNEKVAAAALNDLNNRMQDLANSVIGALNTEV